MKLWKKRMQRVAAMACTLVMCAGMVPTAAFAQEIPAETQNALVQPVEDAAQEKENTVPSGKENPPTETIREEAAEDGKDRPEETPEGPSEEQQPREEETSAAGEEKGAGTQPPAGAQGLSEEAQADLQQDVPPAAGTLSGGGQLDGDYAYISMAGFPDGAGYQGKEIMTGTAPWDGDDANGNDSSASNGTVRSFDVVTYTVEMQNDVREGSPHENYTQGTFHYELILPAAPGEAQFETGSMGWLTSKPGAQHQEVYTAELNGQTVQVLRGSFTWAPSGDNPTAIGDSYQTLNVAIRVLAMHQGDKLQPKFTFWMDHNEVPATGLVTGSGHQCSTHHAIEYKTLDAPEITVTTAPRYNVALLQGFNTNYLGTFDFTTGNDTAANKDAGVRSGRVQAFGVTLQVRGKPGQGLRGCEIPDNNTPITFDLKLSSAYTKTNGGAVAAATVAQNGFAPLLWSAEGNKDGLSQADGRTITQGDKYAFLAAPFNNEDGSPYKQYACKNGGTWSATQSGDTISVTVSGFEADLTRIPNTVAKNDPNANTYYDPAVFQGGYWNVETACFSAGEFWVVQPLTNKGGTSAADQYGDGQFTMTIQDVNLRAKGVSGHALQEVTDNSNQATVTDDSQSVSMQLERPGEIEQYIYYSGTKITNACRNDGKDWSLKGAGISITEQLSHQGAEGQNSAVAYDDLMKFDDAFFAIESAEIGTKSGTDGMQLTLLYGAKPDKSGWDHKGKAPGEAGYDEEMIDATAEDLIFFTSLEELKAQGYVCVAVLLEARGLASPNVEIYFTATGKLQPTATDGNVYMVTHAARAWNKGNVQQAAAAALNKEAAALTDADYKTYAQQHFPSRADKTDTTPYTGYPASVWTNDADNREGLKNYKKSQYNENGYVDGTTGRSYGDSCLVVNYATQIGKRVLQMSSATGSEKLTYDLDSAQNVADYALDLTAIRTAGAFTSGETTTTTVYVEDVLPANLTYIPYSAYLGGTYQQTGEGKQGQVTGGVQTEPEIISNKDGTTTLRWTLPGQQITADETTKIGTIHYSCDISNSALNNDELPNRAMIWSEDEPCKDFTAVNGNQAECSIRVSKNSAVSLSKTADQTRVETGESMGFTMNIGNNAGTPMQIIAVDSLPYSGENSASEMHGDCVVTEFRITALANEFGGNLKLYYTENTALQGKGSAEFQDVNFESDADWKLLTVEPATGKVTLPKDDFKPVAIAAVGSLGGNKTLQMKVTVRLPDGEPGDRVVNRLTMGNMESNGRSYLFGRTLEGLVWLDADKDGLQDDGEQRKSGVTVTLLKLKEGGKAENIADYEEYKVNGAPAAVVTGQKMDLLTGQAETGEEGAYKFLNLPAGTFAVRFADGDNVSLENFAATTPNSGEDDTIDSDATGINNAEGKLDYAYIAGIEMPEEEKVAGNVYEVKHQDLGLVEAKEETIEIPVTKVWQDENDKYGNRPHSITVELWRTGGSQAVQTLELTADRNWSGTFTGLPKTDDTGAEIAYKVKETAVDGYTSAVTGNSTTGFTVTNTPKKTSVSGTKTWEDSNNQDGKRPQSVTVQLQKKDGSGQWQDVSGKTATITDGNWTYQFTDLPKYENGAEIEYRVVETSNLNGYVSSGGTKDVNYNLTNTYSPETTQITVTKVWDDKNDQDGKRPDKISVQLYADNAPVQGKTAELTAVGNWTHTFTGLPKYANGTQIHYSVKEVGLPDGYKPSYSPDGATVTITNTHKPEQIEIPVEKKWDDANNKYGNRPGSITIALLAGGNDTGKTLVLNADNGWKGSFAGLDKYLDGKEIQYTIQEVTVDGYTSEVTGNSTAGFTITNTLEKTSVSGTKIWEDNNNQDGKRPQQITIRLLADGKEVDSQTVSGTGNTWNWRFDDLPVYRDGKKVTYTVQEDAVGGYSVLYKGNQITNTYTPGKTSVSVTKIWKDNDDQDGVRPDSITVRLYADGSRTDKTLVLSESNQWKGNFADLDEYAEGKKIAYTVQEEGLTGEYTQTSLTGDAATGFVITNSYTPKTTQITVSKVWQDNNDQDGIRPSEIQVTLLADGKTVKTETVKPDQNGDWQYTFMDLPVYQNKGTAIQYSVREVAIPGYTSNVAGDMEDGFTITNTHTPETTAVTVTKQWKDDGDRDGKRPESIEIQLLAGQEIKETKTVTPDADGNWTCTFTGLPKYADGKPIQYSVQEKTVEDYTSQVTGDMKDGFTITNAYTPETVDLAGVKAWEDAEDQDGLRPDKITVHLHADEGETPVQTLTVTPDEDGNWEWTFEDLPKYRDGGQLIQYSVREELVDGYDAEVAYDEQNGHTLTNTHIPEVIEIPVTKIWDDAGDQDGKRPDAVTVRLYADGRPLADQVAVLNEETGWQYTFKDLPKYRDGGTEIVYTITEDAVPGYTTVVDPETFTITNSYTPGKTSVSVTKAWDDNGNQDGMRPAMIEIRLLADGNDTGKTLQLTADNGWSGTFGNLDEYKAGQKIRYTIQEVGVHGYESSISGNAVEGYVVTNVHVPERVAVSGRKIWRDASNQSLRPDCITIRLLANGRAVAKLLVTAEDDWQWSFEDLPKYENGKQIVYSISEDKVEGYTTLIDGYNVINTSEWENIPQQLSGSIPQTGDEMPVGLLTGLAALAAGALAALLILRKRRGRKD